MNAKVIFGEAPRDYDFEIVYPRTEDLGELYAAWKDMPVHWETIDPQLRNDSRWGDVVAAEGLPTSFAVQPSNALLVGSHVLAIAGADRETVYTHVV